MQIRWHDIRELGIEGRGWDDTDTAYDRLPARAKGVVRPEVWDLSLCSAGLCVRFVTDAPAIHARWSLRFEELALPHMAATGVSGLDLYVRSEARWRWLAVAKPLAFPDNEQPLVEGVPAQRRAYCLYLPLYNGVTQVDIGVPEGATVEPFPRPTPNAPIVFYGTSITQGGCASRPGRVHTAIIGRNLDRPVINLGFSGNGRMEPELADLLAELDPCIYVLDPLPNMEADEVRERIPIAVHRLRQTRPRTPIVLVEDRTYADAFMLSPRALRNKGNRGALRDAYGSLVAAKVPGIHYLHGDELLGNDNEATVDGSHPTDLGFARQANAMQPLLASLLPDAGA